MNSIEGRLKWAKLPNGTMLCHIILKKGMILRASGDDLESFFYTLRHLDEWVARNAVGHPVDEGDFMEWGGVPGLQYVIAFKVICMGDSNAVDLAQQTHLCALQSLGCMKEEETLEYRKAIPQGSTMEGLYIDDHLCFQLTSARRRLSSTSPHRPQVQKTKLRDEEIMETSRCMYERVGWNRSMPQTFDKIQDFIRLGVLQSAVPLAR